METRFKISGTVEISQQTDNFYLLERYAEYRLDEIIKRIEEEARSCTEQDYTISLHYEIINDSQDAIE